MENGKWKMENGESKKLKIENGELKMDSYEIDLSIYNYVQGPSHSGRGVPAPTCHLNLECTPA